MATISVFRNFFMFLALLFMPFTAGGAQAPACENPVARFMGQDICAAEVEADPAALAAMSAEYEGQGLDARAQAAQENVRRLRDLVWARALGHKFGEDELKATPEEISAYGAAFRDAAARSHENGLKTAALVKKLLAENEYSAQDRAALEAILADTRKSAAFYMAREKHRSGMPPEFSAMLAEAENRIAEAMIRAWKEDRALYRAYGGRVALLSSGRAVPADAQKAFAAYIRKEHGLVVLDSAYRGVFKMLEQPPGDVLEYIDEAKAGRDYFDAPAWQFPGTGAFADFTAIEEKLRAVPVISKP